jgi:tRNA wybutosine-synthesizing protein 4
MSNAAAAVAERKRSYGYDMGIGLTLLSADLKNVDVLLQAMDESRFDFSVPTLLISECVVVYMDKPSVTALCKGLADRFRQEAAAQALWVSYDMVNPHDAFGKVMRRNLGDGGINVPGFTDFPTLQAQGERFTHYGWEGASSITMATVFRDIISPRDRQRIGRLEIFDELEEWDMIMSHYCLTLVSLGVGVSSPLAQVKLNPSLRPDEGATGDAAAGATSKSSPSGWGSFAFSKGGK